MTSFEEMQKIGAQRREEKRKNEERWASIRSQELLKMGIQTEVSNNKDIHGDCDHINSFENSSATIIYILVMIFGSIFNSRWLIWIVATLVFSNFISRHDD
jgi:hypothetical protein